MQRATPIPPRTARAILCLAVTAGVGLASAKPPTKRPSVSVTHHTVAGKPVVVVRPEGTGPWPVVYALPGLGEMVRGPKISAGGWLNQYGLRSAMVAVSSGTLTTKDFGGLVTPTDLASYQKQLARPWPGLVVVCPATPRKLTKRFICFLLDDVIPWAERTLPVRSGARHCVIDGISLGGRHALRIGLRHPRVFRAIGTEQAATGGLGPMASRLIRKAPAEYRHLDINLLTSKRDMFRPKIKAFHERLERLGLRSRFHVTPGGHTKRFARGPGAIDMLMWHTTILHGRGHFEAK